MLRIPYLIFYKKAPFLKQLVPWHPLHAPHIRRRLLLLYTLSSLWHHRHVRWLYYMIVFWMNYVIPKHQSDEGDSAYYDHMFRLKLDGTKIIYSVSLQSAKKCGWYILMQLTFTLTMPFHQNLLECVSYSLKILKILIKHGLKNIWDTRIFEQLTNSLSKAFDAYIVGE